MADIKEITFDKIKSEKILYYLKKQSINLPYAEILAKLYQNGSWHDEYILEHIVSVFETVKKYFRRKNKKIQFLMKKKFDNCSGYDILLYAALFHDIGKFSTQKITEGKISYPGHEKTSLQIFEMQNDLSFKPSLKKQERVKSLLKDIILRHGDIFYFIEKNNYKEIDIKALNINRAHLPYVVLFSIFDMEASKLRFKDPQRYTKLKRIYQTLLVDSVKTEKYI